MKPTNPGNGNKGGNGGGLPAALARISELEEKMEVATVALEAQAIINQSLLNRIKEGETLVRDMGYVIKELQERINKLEDENE